MRRRSIRLPKYGYKQPGAYFVTIYTHNQSPILDSILGGETMFSHEEEIVMKCLDRIPHHFKNSTLDTYDIMPNHNHAIIVLTEDRRGEASERVRGILQVDLKADASPLHQNGPKPRGTKKGSLGAIIQSFKSVSCRKISQYHDTQGERIWQRNYFEHIIRTERALNRIRHYIQINPNRWELDLYNPDAVGSYKEAVDLRNVLSEDVISRKVERLM